MRILLGAILLCLISEFVNAQNYKLVWEDNFNGNSLDSSRWNIEQKIGVWNTGSNREFQHYKKENVSVGSDGLGNNCLILTAKKEEYNGYHYTSGRVNTKGKFAFKRGKIEASIKIPNLANGLWPAFWTLGYTPTGWPDCGEIDILEMGHAAGISAGKQNSLIGSHLFWGPYPRDYGKVFTTNEDLSQSFYKHTLVWDETKVSVYFNDSPSPYFTMDITGSDVEEFRNFQQYLILNLAVGGSVPGIFDLYGITASFPAKMYIDWVKLYQETEDLGSDNQSLYGTFGIYEENAGSDMRMDLGFDLFEKYSGLTPKPGETTKDGSEVLSYTAEAGKDFTLKLTSGLRRNMENYKNGTVQLYIKTNLKGNIQLGVADSSGKETMIDLTDKINRDGSWQPAFLSLADFDSKVDLSALKDMLIIKGNSETTGYFVIDEVVYGETAPVEGVFGIYSNNPIIDDKFAINNVNGFLFNWSNTVSFITTVPAYEGEDVLSFRSSGAANWWGFGIFANPSINLESFANGYLHFAMRTKSNELFRVTINGANESKGEITFTNGTDPYEFARDGKWHHIAVPMSNLTKQGLKLAACGNIFTMSGGSISDVGIDDVYFSMEASQLTNTAVCYATALAIAPKNSTIKTGARKKFNASAKNQYDNPIDAEVVWESNGGTMQQDGNFTSNSAGIYTVIARMNNLADSTSITVQPSTGWEKFDNTIEVVYSDQEKKVSISGVETGDLVEIVGISGVRLFKGIATDHTIVTPINAKLGELFIVTIQGKGKNVTRKFTAQ